MTVMYHGEAADHHVFVVPEIVDGQAVAEQATRKADKLNETTLVHHHAKHHHGKPQIMDNEVACIGYNHDYYAPSPTTAGV
jgi:hypothetical protein